MTVEEACDVLSKRGFKYFGNIIVNKNKIVIAPLDDDGESWDGLDIAFNKFTGEETTYPLEEFLKDDFELVQPPEKYRYKG